MDLKHRWGTTGRIIHHSHWGKGAGVECNLLMWGHGIKTLGLHRIEMTTFRGNIRVLRGLEGLGIPLEGIQREKFFERGSYIDSHVYAFFDRDWLKIKKKLEVKLELHSKVSDTLPVHPPLKCPIL